MERALFQALAGILYQTGTFRTKSTMGMVFPAI